MCLGNDSTGRMRRDCPRRKRNAGRNETKAQEKSIHSGTAENRGTEMLNPTLIINSARTSLALLRSSVFLLASGLFLVGKRCRFIAKKPQRDNNDSARRVPSLALLPFSLLAIACVVRLCVDRSNLLALLRSPLRLVLPVVCPPHPPHRLPALSPTLATSSCRGHPLIDDAIPGRDQSRRLYGHVSDMVYAGSSNRGYCCGVDPIGRWYGRSLGSRTRRQANPVRKVSNLRKKIFSFPLKQRLCSGTKTLSS